ncbi:MAG: hypothetical protein H6825_07070 [Planctomycetes bacterium]|nr:hypothetical protein [Planctomycetota bacterium]
MRASSLAAFLVLLGAPALSAQATFQVLPNTLGGSGISSDGTIVGGAHAAGGGFLWTSSTGVVQVPGLSSVLGLSADGSSLAGTAPGTSQNEAARWTNGLGLDLAGGPPGSIGCGADLSSGYAVSGDGSVLVGLGWNGCKALAFRWDSTNGMQLLPKDGPFSARASVVSRDGLVVGGFDEATDGSRRPALWFDDGSEQILSMPGHVGEVLGVNADGGVAVGTLDQAGFIWTSGGGVVSTGVLSGGQAANVATNADGSVVVGQTGSAFDGTNHATIWTASAGMRKVSDVLAEQGATLPAGYRIAGATGVSDDGHVLTGFGWSGVPLNTSAWVAVLDDGYAGTWTDLGQALAGGGGTPHLTPVGPMQPGTLTRIALGGGAPATPSNLVIGVTQLGAPFKGGTMVPNVDLLVSGFSTAANGSAVISFPWPSGIPSDTTLYYQYWLQDATGPFGFSATNAVSGTTP